MHQRLSVGLHLAAVLVQPTNNQMFLFLHGVIATWIETVQLGFKDGQLQLLVNSAMLSECSATLSLKYRIVS